VSLEKETGMSTSIGIQGVNHVALRVRDVESSAEFYKRVLGFTEEVERFGHGVMAFLRAPNSTNHHDLALLQIGPKAADDSPRSVGMFHFALTVDSIEDLAAGYDRLVVEGCLDGSVDHGATKAVYGRDPDHNTFELTWVLPRAEWGDYATVAPIKTGLDVHDEAGRRAAPPAVATAASNA
jgi:catechol-2,3-dioxygenase